jgi:hypothetical protein
MHGEEVNRPYLFRLEPKINETSDPMRRVIAIVCTLFAVGSYLLGYFSNSGPLDYPKHASTNYAL